VLNQNYEQEIAAMCKDINDQRAMAVFLKQLKGRIHLPTQEELVSGCHLSELKHFSDGIVLGIE
jgi:hypothetical protein